MELVSLRLEEVRRRQEAEQCYQTPGRAADNLVDSGKLAARARSAVLGAITTAMAVAGHDEEALRILHDIGLAEVEDHDLLDIAMALKSPDLMGEVIKRAREDPPESFYFSLATAKAVESPELLREMLRKLQEAGPDGRRDADIRIVAVTMFEFGMLSSAHAAVSSIQDFSRRQEAVGYFAGVAAKAGRLDDAYRFRDIVEPEWRDLATLRITEGLIAAGALTYALKEVTSMESERLRQEAYIALGIARKDAAMIQSAISSWTMPPDNSPGPHGVFARVKWEMVIDRGIGALAGLGHFEEARLAARNHDGISSDQAYARIAEVEARAGLESEALQSIGFIQDRDRADRAVATVAKALAQAGMTEAARRSAGKITDQGDRDFALCEMAATGAERGQVAEAFQLLRLVTPGRSCASRTLGAIAARLDS